MTSMNNQNGTNRQEMTRKERLLLNNPMELASVVRNQTLIIQNGLSLAGAGDDENQPLKVYSSFSRFIFAIINQEKKSVTANIRVTDFPGITAASEYAYRMHMDYQFQAKPAAESRNDGVDTSSPAFTKRFVSGNMKGKTPVQVILEAEDKKVAMEALNKQYCWLKENAEKNPKYADNNREQMKAIKETAALYTDGKLSQDLLQSASNTGNGQVIPLYNSGFRPLRSREKKNGKTFIYEIAIDWTIGSAYPVSITIRNYYAEVTEKENGMLNVLAKTKEQEQKNTMALTSAEWQNITYMAKANMQMFEYRSANTCYNNALKAQRKAREAAGLTTA